MFFYEGFENVQGEITSTKHFRGQLFRLQPKKQTICSTVWEKFCANAINNKFAQM